MAYFPPQQTAVQLLNKLKTVDGSGSGLDADTVDGLHANELSTVASLNDLTDVTLTTPSNNQVLLFNGSIWVNGTISTGVTDHGDLTGLSDDDHSQYLLANGTRTGAISTRQIFTNGITTGSVRPSIDSTTALQLQNSAGTAVVTVDTTNGRIGIGATPTQKLTVVGSGNVQMWIGADTSFGYTIGRNTSTGLLDILGTQSDPFRGLNVTGSITCSGALTPGSLTFNNNVSMQWKDSGGTTRNLIALDGGNNLLIGKSAYGGSTYFYLGASGGSFNFVDNTQSTVLVSVTNAGLLGVGVTATARLDLAASTTSIASLRIRSGTAPTNPNDGDIWFDGTNFKCRISGVTKTFTVE